MTDYNDGKWHIWNGGDCPVHPKSRVKIQMANESRVMTDGCTDREAGMIDWRGRDTLPASAVTAFRVIKEYREPREWWVNEYTSGGKGVHENKEEADKYATRNRIRCIRVREVLE